MIQLMTVPPSMIARVASGAAYVSGAVVKDGATHQVLSHLQPTGRLAQRLLNATGGGPATAGVQLASSIAENFQLLKIQDMLETLQLVSSIGAAASVLNLGVSVGGFVMVLASLRRMEGTLSDVLKTVQGIQSTQTADFLGLATVAVDRAESAFGLPTIASRRRYWEEADLELNRVSGIAVKRLAAQGVVLELSPDDPEGAAQVARSLCTPESRELLRWLLATSSARIEVLLCLQLPLEAARLSRSIATWMSHLPFGAKELAMAQLGGRLLAPSQMLQLTSQASAISTMIARVRAVAEERALLLDVLHTKDVDTLEYVLQVRNDPEERVLMLDHGISG